MKTVIFLLAIIGLYGCESCYNCTRTWTNETYIDSAGIQTHYYLSSAKEIEYFNVCGKSEVHNAEYPTTVVTSQVMDGKIYYNRKKSTCNCVTD